MHNIKDNDKDGIESIRKQGHKDIASDTAILYNSYSNGIAATRFRLTPWHSHGS